MAQRDSAKNVKVDNIPIEATDVMTGDKDKRRFLYYQLKMSMLKAKQIDIIVSFLMESGVRMLLKDFKDALNSYRKLFGNYPAVSPVPDKKGTWKSSGFALL